MIRRALLALLAVAWLPLAGASSAQSRDVQPGDMALGRADAPVTVVEYASVTCPHCANWHETVFPEFKRRFIDTGRVRFVFRELPTQPSEVAIGGFLLARCAPPERYFDVIGELMQHQRLILQSPLAHLTAIGERNGVSQEAFADCLMNGPMLEAVNARTDAAIARGVRGTPTFFVNGEQVAAGEAPLATLEAAIVAAER